MTRTTRLAAALAVAAGAALVPTAAHAADVGMTSSSPNADPVLTDTSGANDVVTVARSGNTVFFTDNRGITVADPRCTFLSPTQASCPLNRVVLVNVGDGNDVVTQTAGDGTQVSVNGQNGNDVINLAVRNGASRTSASGGAGFDTVSYSQATAGVVVTKDGELNDGRVGDTDRISVDVERVEGTPFDDTISGSNETGSFEHFQGLTGSDTLIGNAGPNIYESMSIQDGADVILGSAAGYDVMDYAVRSAGVRATIDSGGNDDGGFNEGDELRGINEVKGSAGPDVMDLTNAGVLFGNGGEDSLTGSPEADTLIGGAEKDFHRALGGNDYIAATDGTVDHSISCGSGTDTTSRDNTDPAGDSCESGGVGILKAKRAGAVQAGQTATLRVAWEHPRSWRKLRSLDVRITTAAGAPVGTVAVKPQTERVAATGAALRLRAGDVRLERAGKRAIALIRVKPTAVLAGGKLGIEVEATDRSGKRQVALRDAVLRVAG